MSEESVFGRDGEQNDGVVESETILDGSAIPSTDDEGQPIPVTIPVVLAPGVRVIYTTRLGGVSEGGYAHCNLGGKGGDDPSHVRNNRLAVAHVVGAPLALVSQVHSGRAVDVDGLIEVSDAGKEGPLLGVRASGQITIADVEADGQVTSRRGVALGMFAADCLPVLLADPEVGVIGAAHCGRKGLERGIIGSVVGMMEDKGAMPNRIAATLGPCICSDCYEVGDGIAGAFDARFPGTSSLTRFGGPGIDIAGAALQELRAAGVPADNVVSSLPRVAAATQYLADDAELRGLSQADDWSDERGSGFDEGSLHVHHPLCTLENPMWYSHRRSSLARKEREGRMLAIVVRD